MRFELLLILAMLTLMGALAQSQQQLLLRPGTPEEGPYLIAQHSVVREIGYDPLCPYTRIADGQAMFYTYRFAPGQGHMAWLMLLVDTQFDISAAPEPAEGAEPVFQRICSVDNHEVYGTWVMVDLTSFLAASQAVLVKFEDRYKEDGWGALLSELRLFDAGPGPATRLELDPGEPVRTDEPVTLTRQFEAPAQWQGQSLGLYLGQVTGEIQRVTLNDKPLTLGQTWDGGLWADVGEVALCGGANRLEVTLRPLEGQVGLWSPVRVGLLMPACAAPQTKKFGVQIWQRNHNFAPYDPININWLAGNYMQCLYDERYDLLTFKPSERNPIHFVHDTSRSLLALADEARYTPVVRLELARRLWRGVKNAELPGGEHLYAFKHDPRPVDIRPRPEAPSRLTLAHKSDTVALTPDMAPCIQQEGNWTTLEDYSDTPVVRDETGWSFERIWRGEAGSLQAACRYLPGDADTPPKLSLTPSGLDHWAFGFEQLSTAGRWFVPGSWGAEAVVLPDGKQLWAEEAAPAIEAPDFDYLLLRGGNSGQLTYCRALLVTWSRKPDRIVLTTTQGGRRGVLLDSMRLEFSGSEPVELAVLPFSGFPEGLKSPRTMADNYLATGKLGAGIYDPVWTVNENGIGPGGLAAAAWLFREFGAPEAEEAEQVALAAYRATLDREREGVTTQQLYHLIHGCEYMLLLGHLEYRSAALQWGDRMLADQAEDGSWPWLNFQLRNMIALIRVERLTLEPRFNAALAKALSTLEWRDEGLFWKGQPGGLDDFTGALPVAIYGALGRFELAQRSMDSNTNYIDDRGFSACSDLNPYMLGISLGSASLPTEPKLKLGLGQFAGYNEERAWLLEGPSCYVVTAYQPLDAQVTLPLVR